MKEVRSLIRWMLIVMILLSPLATSRAVAQPQVNGKVTFKIESKTMTLQEATAARDNKTAIPLKVSLIFEGQWADLLKGGGRYRFNSSAFAFGIAQNGTANAPLYTSNPPAWIYAAELLHCSAPDGGSLVAPPSDGAYLEEPDWERHNNTCPVFSYGTLFSNTNNFNNSAYCKPITYNGKDCYELHLFNIYFRIKDLQTVYVRGIDCNSAGDNLPSTDNQNDLDASTVGTTMLNIVTTGGETYYWPGGAAGSDWTLSGSPKYGGPGTIENQYYGGIIPGGIFIEQSPEVAQFEPCLTGVSGLKFKA